MKTNRTSETVVTAEGQFIVKLMPNHQLWRFSDDVRFVHTAAGTFIRWRTTFPKGLLIQSNDGSRRFVSCARKGIY